MRIITRLNVGGPSYQAIYLTERLRSPEFESTLLVGSLGPDEGSLGWRSAGCRGWGGRSRPAPMG
jgi:hypothetical protein